MTDILHSQIAGDTHTTSDASPEGVVTASRGSLHTDVTLKQLWIKTTESGNEGWELTSGEPGPPGPGGGVDEFFELTDVDATAEGSAGGYVVFIDDDGRVQGFPPVGQDINVEGGTGDGDVGDAGFVYIRGGDGNGAGGAGGVEIRGGTDDGGGGAGAVTITGGSGSAAGGGATVTVQGGGSLSGGGTAGGVRIYGGGSNGASDAGNVEISRGFHLGGGGGVHGHVLMPDLPTSNPLVANALWNDGGTLKISAG